jgi:PKD repeat protein
MVKANARALLPAGLTICLLAFSGAAAWPQVARPKADPLSALERVDERLAPPPATDTVEEAQGLLSPEIRDGWVAFRLGLTGEWKGFVDRRTGRIDYAEGAGIPWLPGRGNSLTSADIAQHLRGRAKADLPALEGIARAFLPRVAHLLGIDSATLVLNPGRSGQPADPVWFVDFDVVRAGLPIDGARVVFRVNHGNLIQLGSENLPAAGAEVPAARITRAQAQAALAAYIGGLQPDDTMIDPGSLHLVPVAIADNRFADGFAFGGGRGLAAVWQLVFRRPGIVGTWRARIDAVSGEVRELVDVNEYAQATGGIYPSSYVFGNETVRPMPFADLSTGGATNSAGIYSYPGGTVTSTLNGPYVRIADTCGAISLTASGSGDLLFGSSAGTDCATPGVGGPGNTHASRMQFYQVNRIKEVGRGWLPANTWLAQPLTVNVNVNQTCNAYWNGSTLNFFKSGGGCGNTGEIAGVSLHEYGHGLDQNDGSGTSVDRGSSEAYADITSVIATHSSCVGPGFFQSGNCSGYGDACASCSGIRELDWAKHASGTPATVGNFTQVRCPSSFNYTGACGREGHCESYVASEALWDFANRDLPAPGTAAAWLSTDRLWYLSRSTATKAFNCSTATNPWTSDGCFAGSWWRTMRAIDDDDGNLANGTPHSCNLYAAFNRHGMACAADAGANTCFAACTPPAAPGLSLTPGNNQVTAAVSGSGVFDLYRNETGCNAGFIKIADDLAATSYTDGAVANGVTYYYLAVAQPSGDEACASAPSVCQSIAPAPDQPPAASFTWSCTGRACSFDGSASTDDHGIASYAWNFGDGGTASGATPSHTYTADNTYTVTLTVTDAAGHTAQTTHAVQVVDDPPHASFYVGCIDRTCTADSEASGDDYGIVNYTWTWGDGQTTSGGSSVSAPSHTYAAYGTYTIVLTVRDAAGQTSSDSHTVSVSRGPAVAFTFTCTGRSCDFDASGSSSDVAITSYTWDFGDETPPVTLSTPAAHHVFAYDDTFTVHLTVTDAAGNSGGVSHAVSVLDYPPYASFYVGCNGHTCTADSEASGDDYGIVNYTWTWGDGQTTSGGSPVSAPTHTYAANGTYTITLVVTDISGQTSTDSHPVTVDQAPAAAFSITCTGRSCDVDGSASSDDLGIASYFWDWDDESTTSTTVPTAHHDYPYDGTFTVVLTVYDTTGNVARASHTINTTGGSALVASFAPTCATTDCQFDAGSSIAGQGIAGYQWEWGDGQREAGGAKARHAYSAPGAYTVILTLADNTGHTTQSTKRLTVRPAGSRRQTPGAARLDTPMFRLLTNQPGNPVSRAAIAGARGLPIAGDWDGDGVDSIGRYDPITSTFRLRNANSSGPADMTFVFGTPGAGWLPVAGDWNGDGVDTIGLYDPRTGTFHLRNSNSAGAPDLTFSFLEFGPGWRPVAGDWDGDGVDTVGLYDPQTGAFYLRGSNTTGAGGDLAFIFIAPGAGQQAPLQPTAGDWDGDGWDSVGVFDPATGKIYLRNLSSAGPADVQYDFRDSAAPQGSVERVVAGHWSGH